MANLHKHKWVEDECNVELPPELVEAYPKIYNLVSKVLKQISKQTPFKINLHISKVAAKSMTPWEALNYAGGRKTIYTMYVPGEDYSLWTRIANATTTKSGNGTKAHSGLIRINDKRLQEATGGDNVFLANIIGHEVLHILGIDHCSRISNEYGFITKNRPIMVSGKAYPLGLSYDDKQGLKQQYKRMRRNVSEVTVKANGKQVVLENLDQPRFSVGKDLADGQMTMTHVKPGKYAIVVDQRTLKKCKIVEKNYEIDLTDIT